MLFFGPEHPAHDDSQIPQCLCPMTVKARAVHNGPMIDLSYIGRTKGIIEALFSQVGLQLEIMIFFKDTLQETAGRNRTYPDPNARKC